MSAASIRVSSKQLRNVGKLTPHYVVQRRKQSSVDMILITAPLALQVLQYPWLDSAYEKLTHAFSLKLLPVKMKHAILYANETKFRQGTFRNDSWLNEITEVAGRCVFMRLPECILRRLCVCKYKHTCRSNRFMNFLRNDQKLSCKTKYRGLTRIYNVFTWNIFRLAKYPVAAYATNVNGFPTIHLYLHCDETTHLPSFIILC